MNSAPFGFLGSRSSNGLSLWEMVFEERAKFEVLAQPKLPVSGDLLQMVLF